VTDFYVYVFYRPDRVPCYIGKGRGKRLRQHLWRSENEQLEALLQANGRCLPHERIAEGLDHIDALAIEMALIRDIGRIADGGPLFNKSRGGFGCAGYVFPQAARLKISEALKGKKRTPETLEKQKGRVFSEETRAKMRAAKLGKKLPREHREAIGAAHRGKVRSEEWRQNISLSKIGHVQSEATKLKISATKLAGKPSR
jgi:hypothetical protein